MQLFNNLKLTKQIKRKKEEKKQLYKTKNKSLDN